MNHERVAALHDGRLGPRERDELLNELLANDDEYELFAETAAVLREIEEARAGVAPSAVAPAAPPAAGADEGVIALASRRPPEPVAETEAESDSVPDRENGVIPLAPRRPGRTRWMAYGALAAGLAGLALAAALLTNRGSGRLDDPAGAIALLESGATGGVVPGLNEVWRSGTRGRGERNVTSEKLAVKLGAYHVDLELADAARDRENVVVLSGRMAGLLNDTSTALAGTSALQQIYRQIGQAAARGENVEGPLEHGRQLLRDSFDPEWLELGIWAETARTAAVRHDAAFFRSRDSRAALERIAALPDIDEPLAAVQQVLPADGRIDWPPGDPRWTTLAERLATLLREAGR